MVLLGPPSITILVPHRQCSAFIRASLGIAWEQGGDEGDRPAPVGSRSDIRFQAQKYPCQDLSTGTSGSQGFAVEQHVRSWSPAAPALTFWCHCSLQHDTVCPDGWMDGQDSVYSAQHHPSMGPMRMSLSQGTMHPT